MRKIVALVILISIGLSSAQAELISKVSDEFERSDIYWKELNPQIAQYLDIPFYFNVPLASFSPLTPALENSRTAKSPTAPLLVNYRKTSNHVLDENPDAQLGLRLVVVNKEASRKQNAHELADSGLFQAGDVVLSFRKEWYRTLRYSHIQLGISHAGLLYIEKGADGRNYLKNLDMPLDDKHVGQGYLNSDHYLNAPLLHVVRPRNLTETQKQNINKWLQRLAKVGPKAYAEGKIRFNQDYAAPKFKQGEDLTFIGDLGRIALGATNKTQLTMYCSEFAWSVLSLRDCNIDDANVIAEFKKGGAPSCIKELFAPMPLLGTVTTEGYANSTVGLLDGVPLIMMVQNGRIPDAQKRNEALDKLIENSVFDTADGDATNISSGHRAVEEGVLNDKPDFYEGLKTYFQLVNDENAATNPMILGIRAQMNAAQPLNYSPTAFIVHGLLPNESTAKALDYVGTITYTGKLKGTDTYNMLRRVKVDAAK